MGTIFMVTSDVEAVRNQEAAGLQPILNWPPKLAAREPSEAPKLDASGRRRDARGRFIATPRLVSLSPDFEDWANALVSSGPNGLIAELQKVKYQPIRNRYYAIWMIGTLLGMGSVGWIVHHFKL